MITLMPAALALLLLGQQPTSWVFDPTLNEVRRVHRGPLEGRTTVWVRLAPRAADPELTPTSFVFVAEFPGKRLHARPEVTLHIATDVRFYPLTPRVPTLLIAVDEDEPLDLLGPGEQTSVSYCCAGELQATIPTGATLEISAERLDRLAVATAVAGDVFGVPFTLDVEQLAAIAEFRRTILPESY